MPMGMNIGQAAAAAQVSAKMVRHYEQIGLLPPAARTAAGYRQYSERDVAMLRFIHRARQLGFSMAQIGELMGLWNDGRRSSRTVKALAQSHLDGLNRKMQELAQMQAALQRLVAACSGDEDPHCAILDELSVQGPLPPPTGAAACAGSPLADLMAWTRAARAAPPGA